MEINIIEVVMPDGTLGSYKEVTADNGKALVLKSLYKEGMTLDEIKEVGYSKKISAPVSVDDFTQVYVDVILPIELPLATSVLVEDLSVTQTL